MSRPLSPLSYGPGAEPAYTGSGAITGISGAIRRIDGVDVRIVSATQPESQARRVPPTLEDAYLHFIGKEKHP